MTTMEHLLAQMEMKRLAVNGCNTLCLSEVPNLDIHKKFADELQVSGLDSHETFALDNPPSLSQS